MNIGLAITSILLIIIVYFIIRKNKEDQPFLQLDQLESYIAQLIDGELEFDFFGITSSEIDCIYFVNNQGKINIEYEVMYNEQKPYVEKLTHFASKNGFSTSTTTYGNQPHYSETKEAPVYSIELQATKEKAAEVGTTIMKTIFNSDESTEFIIVP